LAIVSNTRNLPEPQRQNLAGLAGINGGLIVKAETIDWPPRVVLDLDSTETAVRGEPEPSADQRHLESTCSHPLGLFTPEGHCHAAELRPGIVHRNEDREELLPAEIERQQMQGKGWVFRADAASANSEIYEALERRGVKFHRNGAVPGRLYREEAGPALPGRTDTRQHPKCGMKTVMP
jgi:hypothetical protein